MSHPSHDLVLTSLDLGLLSHGLNLLPHGLVLISHGLSRPPHDSKIFPNKIQPDHTVQQPFN
ncbi:hypothetical protein Len3610_10900 [Lentibacillus sp. CBA3610]|nr:hypothetical protein Len3610_10900 [Lentibacillus sp. CBA3610]